MQDEIAVPPMTRDDESQLDLLATAHYIVGGVGIFLSLFSLIYVVLGIAMISGAMDGEVPPFAGWFCVILGGVGFVCGEAASICIIISGKHLKRRTGYTFSFVVACISCISVPVGTILGVLTIIVLARPAVKAAFERR